MIFQYQFADKETSKSGCYYLDLLRMIEIEKNVHISERQATEIKGYCKNLGYIKDGCQCEYPDDILKMVGSNIRQIGKDNQYWLWVDDENKIPDFIIVDFSLNDTRHNILCNANLIVLYDSLNEITNLNFVINHKVYYRIFK